MREITLTELREAIRDLKAGRKLLSRPGGWIQGALFEGSEKVCSLGALGRVRNMTVMEEIRARNIPAAEFLACTFNPELAEDDPDRAIIGFNDDRINNLEDILAGWDLAIELAENTLKSIPDKES